MMPPNNRLEVQDDGYRIAVIVGVEADPGKETVALRRAGEVTDRIAEVL